MPDEAKLVRRIFRLYLEGNSINKIAETLTKEGIRTVTGNTVWHATVISKMLMNEKYMGDALLQKNYTVDFLEKKRAVNQGIVPQYYIEGNHEAIIPRELFYQVQEERARRANVYRPANKKGATIRGRYSSKYVLADIMYCKECGQPYRRQVWVNGGTKKPVWRCYSRLKNGTKKCKHSPSLEEKALHEAIMEAVNSVVKDEGEFIDAFRDNVIRILGSYSDNVEPTEYDEKIDSLQKQMLALIEDSAKTESADEEFDRAYREIADQIRVCKKKGRSYSGKSSWPKPTTREWKAWANTFGRPTT